MRDMVSAEAKPPTQLGAPSEQAPTASTLPDTVRREIAAVREQRRLADQRLLARSRRLRLRTILEATLLFVVFETLLTYFEGGRALASIPCGIALGMAWHAMAAGRFLCLVTGVLAHVGFRSIFGFGDAFTALFGSLAFACVATSLGTAQESRRRDGGYRR